MHKESCNNHDGPVCKTMWPSISEPLVGGVKEFTIENTVAPAGLPTALVFTGNKNYISPALLAEIRTAAGLPPTTVFVTGDDISDLAKFNGTANNIMICPEKLRITLKSNVGDTVSDVKLVKVKFNGENGISTNKHTGGEYITVDQQQTNFIEIKSKEYVFANDNLVLILQPVDSTLSVLVAYRPPCEMPGLNSASSEE